MNNWNKRSLGSIARLQAGTGFPINLQGRTEARYPFYKVGDISRAARQGKSQLDAADHYVSDDDISELRATPLPAGAIVFAKIGEAIRQNFFAITSSESLVDNNAMGVVPDPQQVTLPFLFRFLKTLDFYQLADKTSVPSIRKSTLERLMIPLPPLEEQRRIAAILDKADALRQKRRAALQKLDSLTQSLFLDMFGDPAVNPKQWPTAPFKQIAAFTTGKLDSNAAVEGGPFPFFTCSREDFSIDVHAFDCEALLLAGNNAAADYSVKHYKGKFNAYQRTYVITLKTDVCGYEYMHHALQAKLQELKHISKGTGTRYLTLEILHRLQFGLPPLALQRKFAASVSRLRAHRSLIQKVRSSEALLFDVLQHRAFRGEL